MDPAKTTTATTTAAASRKYDGLPDLDSAPDIYETPELTDDNSTRPATTIQTRSDDEPDEDEEEGGDNDERSGISRSRLRVDAARSRFRPGRADAGGAGFSGRVDGKRRAYKTSGGSNSQRRRRNDGTLELGDLSSDDGGGDEEGLDRRMARLRREVQEVKAEYERRKTAAKPEGGEQQNGDTGTMELAGLSSVLDEMASVAGIRRGSLLGRPSAAATTTTQQNKVATETAAGGEGAEGATEATYTITYAPTYAQSHALAKAADFDRRLVLLERAIGIGSSALPEMDPAGLPRAIMPTIDNLQRQVSTLSQASTASLDTTARRVRALAHEVTQLNDARARGESMRAADQAAAASAAAAAAAATAIATMTATSAPAAAASADDSDQVAKINALYGTLPTIESLAPLLPPLLDRLRSLRTLHADAANAASALAQVESRQTQMAAELRMWREGLEKVEAKVAEGEETMKKNVEVMAGWVKDLEARIQKLP